MLFSSKYLAYTFVGISILLYLFCGYFLERSQFTMLLITWLLLFVSYFILLKNTKITFTNLAIFAVLFRLILLFSVPNLSQDFYRFIWDGRMILNGLNPYLSLPKNFIEAGNYPIAEALELYQGMGKLNASNYTNYPPINQLCFLIAALLSSKSIFGAILVFKTLIILADIGVLYFGKKLLERLNLPIKNIFWYILNPFIIIEMTGNLHFEPVMLFFLVFGLYKLHQQKWLFAAILLACSISVKLIPLLFLPLFFQWFVKTTSISALLKSSSFYKLIGFYIIILLTTLLLFSPFYSSEFVANYSKSVGLWFKNFEFNASFYYLFREIGYLFRGYNEIAVIGKITPILTIIFLFILTFFRKNNSLTQIITAMLFGLCFYYFTATTVHPWYIATPLILTIFTKYKFPILWSFVVILSYQAYANTPFKENLFIIFIQYTAVFIFMFYEIKQSYKIKKLQNN